MDISEVVQEGNEVAMLLCKNLLEKHGPGRNYDCAVISAATTLLFHVYRLGIPKGTSKELVQAVLSDVSYNLDKYGDHKVSFKVE